MDILFVDNKRQDEIETFYEVSIARFCCLLPIKSGIILSDL